MKLEYDFSKGKRGRFFRPNAKLRLPRSREESNWGGPGGDISDWVEDETRNTLRSYRAQPNSIIEHVNLERTVALGGYAHRQLFELVQNSADALANSPTGGSILVRLTENHLYCADDGEPIDKPGIRALMFSHMSTKKATNEIGRFGLGFKSVLGVTDTPEFYSRSVSFRFDKKHAVERITTAVDDVLDPQTVARIEASKHYPILRLPTVIDAREAMKHDDDLREMTTWATNIVRLPLKPGARQDLAEQINNFRPEFLLFVDHVRHLILENGEVSRDFAVRKSDNQWLLHDDNGSSRWMLFHTMHQLSPGVETDWHARGDNHDDGDNDSVPIWWAVPLDRLSESGYFWHFFPTETTSLLAGILNAPWKTNQDRQYLLKGSYNRELIDAAANLVAESLPRLNTDEDPARHLDALPRRYEAGDDRHSKWLREGLNRRLRSCDIVPDQDGQLYKPSSISYAPEALVGRSSVETALKAWESFRLRPSRWLHHRALTRNRIAKVKRLLDVDNSMVRLTNVPILEKLTWPTRRRYKRKEIWSQAPKGRHASLHQWLEALVRGQETTENKIAASRAALQVAASVPHSVRKSDKLGKIILTRTFDWCAPHPDKVFLGSSDDKRWVADSDTVDVHFVHEDLFADRKTRKALRELGIKHFSQQDERRLRESHLRKLSRKLHDSLPDVSELQWKQLWQASRHVSCERATNILRREWTTNIRICTESGRWQPLYSTILPDNLAPRRSEHGRRDYVIDTAFHDRDIELLKRLGAGANPRPDSDLSGEPWFRQFLEKWRQIFKMQPLENRPRTNYLNFESTHGSGPLDVLKVLPDEARARYTDALLRMESTYEDWTMCHQTRREHYPDLPCVNPAIEVIRHHGRIECDGEFYPIESRMGRHVLRSHPMSERIRKKFELPELVVIPIGDEDEVPLGDEWPGLASHLTSEQKTYSVVRCERLSGEDGETLDANCVRVRSSIYLIHAGEEASDENRDLRLVCREIGLDRTEDQLKAIRRFVTPREIEARRTAVRELASNAKRLGKAIGDEFLREHLPVSLLASLDGGRERPRTDELAKAAMAIYHNGTLRKYRRALRRLDPPGRWAGSRRAVSFVKSLGFSADWAGQRNSRRDPYLEVDGPYLLPELHDYQRAIVDNVRSMLRTGNRPARGRRGMISLPTGAGKTRVAVQAIVEAIRDDGFDGGVLWVADRDELCEQAVQAWRQIWLSVGEEGRRLRISRMWGGQPRPLLTSGLHVIVATIQTLRRKLTNPLGEYGFLADCDLVVFDEAHRSVAQSYTSVMEEIGLTRWRRQGEPSLLGLTATPYRGHDEAETRRLVHRYGSNRLDGGVFTNDSPAKVVGELQQDSILAYAKHQLIEGGGYSLDERELATIEAMPHVPWLPQSVENRIAQDVGRTKRVVEAAYNASVKPGSPNRPTLVFATSVEHAKTVAALLNLSLGGVTARAVSGDTEQAVRRDIVEQFRGGRIDILVNYGVFREGFDAPKTGAIIVARPVYSPNVYFQMIGRGLRGPRNGGNHECLIVNVRDNIANFRRKLAFSGLHWLWDSDERTRS